jgi:hypothetical protein
MSTSASDCATFHYTSAMRELCADMVSRVAELRHIHMDQVAVGFCQTRRNVRHGMQASLTPLRFAGGATTEMRRRRQYVCPRILRPEGGEFLYLLNYYLPRFQDLPLEEKLTTVVHELWHIGPNFDGDLRRHEGRCYAHGASQRAFDAHAAGLARQWLATSPPPSRYEFLQWNFRDLQHRKGTVVGTRFPTPKLELCQAS